MSVSAYLKLTACLGIIALTSCSGPTVSKPGTSEFYWSAAKETYTAGDYLKTADHLEHLVNTDSEFAARAIPWYLVLTSGVAEGYMDLADQYTAGARRNKEHAVAFHVKASSYRALANRMALRFAQTVDKMDKIPFGTVPLAFPLPKGNAEQSSLLASIAGGAEIPAADAETAEALTVQHAVLMNVCLAAGSPNDVAKTAEVLAQSYPGTTRSTFGTAIAHMLDSESSLYGRTKLDDPEKQAIFHQRAQRVLVETAKTGSAMILQAGPATVVPR